MTRAAVSAVLACVLCALAGATGATVQAQAAGDIVAEFRRTAPADADSARAALRQLLLQTIARLERPKCRCSTRTHRRTARAAHDQGARARRSTQSMPLQRSALRTQRSMRSRPMT
jgi:hypothetical protein